MHSLEKYKACQILGHDIENEDQKVKALHRLFNGHPQAEYNHERVIIMRFIISTQTDVKSLRGRDVKMQDLEVDFVDK